MKLLVPILGGLLALAPAACERGGDDAKKAPAEPAAATDPPPATTTAKAAPRTFGTLTIDEVAARIGSKGVHLIDNNPRDVFDKGHVPGARWVDTNTMTAADLPSDKDATLVFYCANEH